MVLAIGSGRRRSAVDIWGADGALGAGGESVAVCFSTTCCCFYRRSRSRPKIGLRPQSKSAMVGFYGSRKQHVSCRLPHLERRLVLDTQLLTFGSAMEDPRYPRKLQLTDDLMFLRMMSKLEFFWDIAVAILPSQSRRSAVKLGEVRRWVSRTSRRPRCGILRVRRRGRSAAKLPVCSHPGHQQPSSKRFSATKIKWSVYTWRNTVS
ncbi:hypothetical protein F4820DRAFT_381273 [Hypoxylon rubiginosum]|uniref:Uncharacterized protein n=1 Tax=Hypoxylon rubiginosum TaxID=110542 RepID=A0ACB9YUU9_9PEZI|nr:hypothetical protein F4820DRAFT_381273 [Hypoxylon rubiginosum]